MIQQKLPLGIVNFEEMRTPDAEGRTYVYVDKTEDVASLVRGSKFNFLARPRRYGKSLLHSVLYHLFSGHRHLFDGLWIAEEGRWNWEATHPVIRIDFNSVGKQDKTESTGSSLADALNRYMIKEAAIHDITLTGPTAGEKLQELIEKLKAHTGQDVVILIDEYDKPLVNYLEENLRHIAEENRQTLRNFYSVLKGNDLPLRFLLLTGVSKFGRLSIFSDLSQLVDLTLHERYAAMLGYTREEIETCFGPWLADWMQAEGFSHEELWAYLTDWYNGYSWNGRDFLYTPWSILNALNVQKFYGFWSLSGTPKMLVDLLREKQIPLPQIEGQWVRGDMQDRTSLEAVDPTALFWQTGYLTVKERKSRGDRLRYRLGLPNREVRESFLLYYLDNQQKPEITPGHALADGLYDSLLDGDLPGFMERIGVLLAKVPYHLYPNLPQEKYFHTIVFLAAMLCGHRVAAEVAMASGRIDTVLETDDTFYVFEFKLDGTPVAGTPVGGHSVTDTLGHDNQEEEDTSRALNQIANRDYTRAYFHQGKRVIAVGATFQAEPQNRRLAHWQHQEVFTP